MILEMQVLAWDRHTHVAGLNYMIEPYPYPLLIIGSPVAIHKYNK
jgi:hypothetical protein